MECADALSLVEKLADSEASSAEKREAEAHLDGCSHCREHLEFLTSLASRARSSAADLPEPPEAYWENLPLRVLDRVEFEKPRPLAASLWRSIVALRLLRWQAVFATTAVLAAVGVVAFREGSWRIDETSLPAAIPAPAVQNEPRSLDAPAAPPPPAAPADVEVPNRSRESRDEKRAAPPMARDEQTPAALAEQAPEKAEAVPAPAAAPPDAEEKEPREKEMLASERMNSAVLVSRASTPDDCAELRRAASEYAEDASGSDVRYELALCSFRRYLKEPSDAVRSAAIEDAEAFLESEKDGPRAEGIRKLLERLRESR